MERTEYKQPKLVILKALAKAMNNYYLAQCTYDKWDNKGFDYLSGYEQGKLRHVLARL